MTNPKQNNYLVISAMGADRPGIVDEFSGQIFECGCNIEDSRMAVLGKEFALILLVSGRWDAIAKLETALDPLAKRLDLSLNQRRTDSRAQTADSLPYAVDVSAMDQPGIVHKLSKFLAKRGINIEDMSTARYPAPHTGTPMFGVHMTIGIPAKTQIAALRDDFLDFCDQLNIDAVMEPLKN
ncbi:MAG: glycine cleavage system protein R [Gammaproteobacteria bacterium]|nr:glycine cleavage system protein R [Gammaproteobacteria bacterium]